MCTYVHVYIHVYTYACIHAGILQKQVQNAPLTALHSFAVVQQESGVEVKRVQYRYTCIHTHPYNTYKHT